jgi:hypothetical protein
LYAQTLEPLPESKESSIGYPTIADAIAALRAKPGVQIRVEQGWTIVEDGRTLWTFTPDGHPAHPTVVKRTVVEDTKGVWMDMDVLCQAAKKPCDALVREFQQLNESTRATIQMELTQKQFADRNTDAEAFASHWLDLLEQREIDQSLALLTDSFKANLTREEWATSISASRQQLGQLKSRKLRRIVWYDNPPSAPRPGVYAAVEFDSVYENTREHFQYVMLHSLNDEPFKVARHESTVVFDK